MIVFEESLGVASAKPVPFVSTLKKAGGAGPQRGSKGEEVTPVPGGGGAGGEVRKEPDTPTITRRAKSTNPSPSVLTLCVCFSPIVRAHCSDEPAPCRLSTALHTCSLKQRHSKPHTRFDCKLNPCYAARSFIFNTDTLKYLGN